MKNKILLIGVAVLVQGCGTTYKSLTYAEQKMTLEQAKKHCSYLADDAADRVVAAPISYQSTGRPTVDAAANSGAQMGRSLRILSERISIRSKVKERCMYQQGYEEE
ncbi:MAG: hypothetical protein H8D41_02105 [bacterium]|nr:hypothetical protein [Candidatus Thioglobus pontius]